MVRSTSQVADRDIHRHGGCANDVLPYCFVVGCVLPV
jgi:hypothetical protein